MTTTWHLDDETIDRYADDRLGDAFAASLEAHVIACATCRVALAGRVGVDREGWAAVRVRIERPRAGLVECILRGAGVPGHVARILVASPALRLPWLVAVGFSLLFAALASRSLFGDPLPFVVLAPLVPIAGVAAAFGGRVDPLWEVGLSSPTGGFRLTMLRAASVLATSVALTGMAAVLLPDGGWLPVAWLLPSLALTVLALALSSTSLSPIAASVAVGTAWMAGMLVVTRTSSEPLAVFDAAGQWSFALVALVAAAVLVVRRAAFERPGSM